MYNLFFLPLIYFKNLTKSKDKSQSTIVHLNIFSIFIEYQMSFSLSFLFCI